MRILMKNQMLFCTVALTIFSLTGCATTPKPTLTTTQCQSANWQAIGYQDGLLGRSADFIQKHREACGSLPVVKTEWQQGREAGLQKYCTPLRAYQLGREGFAFNNVCPPDMTLDLLKSHDEGYAHYQRERALQDFYYNDWYPFGWGRYPYGLMLPRRFVSPTLPNYVDLPADTKTTP